MYVFDPTWNDRLLRGLCAGGAARFLAVRCSDVARYAAELHELDAGAARTAAEAITAAVLMSAWIKGEERVTLQVQAERPVFSFIGDVDAAGGLRARFSPRRLARPADGRIEGLILAIKADRDREIYRGVTPLHGERIDAGLRAHLGSSDQVDVALRIEATAGEDGKLALATGILVERLPEEPGKPSLSREDFAARFAALDEADPAALLADIEAGRLLGDPVETLEERRLHWRCACGPERVEAVLAGLDPVELRAMADEDGGAEVTCHFCNLSYRVEADRLREMAAAKEGAPET